MASPELVGTAPGLRDRPAASSVLFVLSAAVAALVAALVVGLSAANALVLLGIPDPGPLTTYGLPAVRAIAEGAGVISIGSLLLAAFLVPPQRSGILDVDGYRAVRIASNAALAWAICAALLVPLTLSDTSGQSIAVAVRAPNFWSSIGQVELASAWRATAIMALVLAVACRVILRWGWTPLLLGLALFTLMPLAITGHSSAGGSHDVATNSLILHLVSASLWAGGLFALLVLARHGGAHTDVAARRFSALAGVAYVVIAVSGVLNTLVRIPLSDLFTSTYGRLVLAKVAALIALGCLGFMQRKRSLPALAADPTSRSALLRFAGIEAILFAATIGLAVGLGRTPPPADAETKPSLTEVALGYNLDGPPTFARILFDWRFDLIYGTAAIVMAVLYVVGVRHLRARGDKWPVGRTIAWLAGCLTILFATSSGMGRYAPAMFSVHMEMHMALSMLAPVLLVLGGPVTLALRALKPAGKDAPPGLREWVLAAVHNPVSRFLTHPIVASVIFVGSFYGLYFGGIFNAVVDSHAAHLLMNLHFLVSGYLFYWVVIGVDPSPRRVPPVVKVAMVFATLPFHAFFGVTLMSMDSVMGGWFYRTLGLPWHINLLSDQHLGGAIAWATGEVPLVLVMLALLVQWSRSDRRTAKRIDRAADRDDDAELAAYNRMLAELTRRERESQHGPPSPSSSH
ncbi:copper resistance protein CopD [Skermania sp. ID1734]|uniref:cytochrome c oxidase assembly protein n=1 Tax=Skermania sp. ID1734 TaxID=2597516 RepID=UPI00117E5DF5|nr:cytochrome c oxidase assembly protein [Skermania sp. ID1734]TSD99985.1 copper resistance protein CopD [Skermania sp. ID1734]